MMRIGVISDTHGDSASLAYAITQMESAGKPDVLIHLGDGVNDVERYLQQFGRSYLLRGNWDGYSPNVPMEEKVILDGIPFLLTHGHAYKVKHTLSLLLSSAAETGVQAALFGHTHIPYCRLHHGILLMNPGACSNGHYAVLRLRGGLIEPELF